MNKLQLIDADTLYYKPLAHPKCSLTVSSPTGSPF